MGKVQRWESVKQIAQFAAALALATGLYLCRKLENSRGELMSVFGWLILGHFVADWILQNDWMALGKTKGLLAAAGFTHYLVYTATILIFLAIATPNCATTAPLFMITLVVFLSHWLIDGGNLAWRWMQCFGQRDQTMVRVVIDQTFHLLVLGGIVSVCLGNIPTI